MMKIDHSTEMMKNQKHAVVMSPDEQFAALQTPEGHSLFFSIGTDKAFYLTCETPADTAGWSKTDLSTVLAENYKGTAVTAKAFSVAQNLAAGTVDLALVITAGNHDHLYLSLGNPNSNATWSGSTPLVWTPMPYDDANNAFSGLLIAGIYMSPSGSNEYIVADIIKEPASPVTTIYRYFIDPSKKLTGQAWNGHDLSGNLQEGKITNCLGRRKGQRVDGIYTMGDLRGETELIYTPLYNVFDNTAPNPVRLGLPPDATAMALSVKEKGVTDLFLAAGGGLYFAAADEQHDMQQPRLVHTHELLNGIQALHANNDGTRVVVWGLNGQGQVFYLECPVGSEPDPASWSTPIPIMDTVVKIAAFLNKVSGNSVLFAQGQEDILLQLTQDPITTLWQQRSIVLPATDVDDILEMSTYCTHLQITDDNNLALADQKVLITSSSPCSVYIDDDYHLLHPDAAVEITTGHTGTMSIVQQVDSIGAVCYNVSVGDQKVNINPMQVMVARLQQVTKGSDLDVTITDEWGQGRPLVDSTAVSASQKDAIAKGIAQFALVAATMPQDGSVKNAAVALRFDALDFGNAGHNRVFGMNFAGHDIVYYEGPSLKAEITDSAIAVAGGDIWRWVKNNMDKVEGFFVETAGRFTRFVIGIAGTFYEFMINCINDVVQGIGMILHKIGVAVKDLIDWLGFVFNWKGIVHTKDVLKNVLKQYLLQCVADIKKSKLTLAHAFASLEKNIDHWADLPSMTDADSYGSLSAAVKPLPGQNSPQAHWGINHLQKGIKDPSFSYSYSPAGSDQDPVVKKIFAELLLRLQQQGDTFKAAYEKINNIAINLGTLSPNEIIQQLIGILSDAVLESAKNIITLVMDVFSILLDGFMDALEAEIRIPVISHLYKKASGKPLSALDLSCLVLAIPVYVIYKQARYRAPFSDDTITPALIKANDFASIQQLFASEPHGIALAGSATAADAVYDDLAYAGNILAFFGAIAISVCGPLKANYPEVKRLAFITGLLYIPYVAPDIIGAIRQVKENKWYAWMNEVLAVVGTLKALVDISSYKKTKLTEGWELVSAWLDFLLNLIWEAPTIGAIFYEENRNRNGYLNYWGSTFFNCSGILAPAVAYDKDPDTKAASIAASTIFNILYGIMCKAQCED